MSRRLSRERAGPAARRAGLAAAIVLGLAAPPIRAETSDAPRPASRVEILAPDELFPPLVADPAWPRFSAEHQWRLGTDQFDRLLQVGFGEAVSLVRGPIDGGGRWEFGLQALLDAVLDLEQSSFDLTNEDYYVGITGAVEWRGFVAQLRLSHLSSHLGDEYAERTASRRDDVSLETLDLLVSHAPTETTRVYGGLGVMITPEPPLDPVFFQFGAEWLSRPIGALGLRTVAGVDVRLPQEGDWIPEVGALAALRLSNAENASRHVELFARYYHGRSPEGQFFRQDVDLLSVGIRLGL